jgi:hypothetical protein
MVQALNSRRGSATYCELGTVSYLSSTGGEVANAQVCKTCIRGFNPRPVLQILQKRKAALSKERGFRKNRKQ